MALGVTAITTILFVRAYHIWMRRTWMLLLGSFLVFVNFMVGVAIYPSFSVHMDESHSCWMGTNTLWSMAKFAADIITNVVLSGLYLRVLSQTRHSGFSAALYQELYREGFVSAFLVILSTVITAIFVFLRLAPDYEPFIYGLDIVINTTIIGRMLYQRHSSKQALGAKYADGRKRPATVPEDARNSPGEVQSSWNLHSSINGVHTAHSQIENSFAGVDVDISVSRMRWESIYISTEPRHSASEHVCEIRSVHERHSIMR
ncbi:hypothetical protein THASP1DRAFT_23954 [Thamnocephalis sphaerospora]|uniref:Uncharacterized protein n=1 Tax=Thamnocephalis sphaerospora TaxID=78915 RepID=A0A4P9XPN3_9FUNG|nr:hypothetical protein THASP1DRAFT_23954 [Thamnocephalis sphaerospora]|eukprot:RKP07974.1 hypothetical protein THASP1DRAFT_23954 [Thamnocephalis sphaerospora]